METPTFSAVPRRFAAALSLVALLATGCGATVTTAGERAVVEIGEAPAPVEAPGAADTAADDAAPAAVETEDAAEAAALTDESAPSFSAPLEHDAPGFGSTLAEWGTTTGSGDGDTTSQSPSPGYSVLEWDDLIPPGFTGEEIMARYDERLDAVEVGSDEAMEIYFEMREELTTDNVNPAIEGQKVRLAGFVAPLTFEDEVLTEFLLVPNFGACIHVPPTTSESDRLGHRRQERGSDA